MSSKRKSTQVTPSHSKKSRNNNHANALEEWLSKKEWKQFQSTYKSAKKLSPILVLKWNADWLSEDDHENVQQDVIDFILQNGGTDKQDSRMIFNFQTFSAMLGCRDKMNCVVKQAFHAPEDLAMAEAWIVTKRAVLPSDCAKDSNFFINLV